MKAIHVGGPRLSHEVAACLNFANSARNILFLGSRRKDLFRELSARACRVTWMPFGDEPAAQTETLQMVVEPAAPDLTRLPAVLNGGSFDAVIMDDSLSRFIHPQAMLCSLHSVLGSDGCVIATLPNPARATMRLTALTPMSSAAASDAPGGNGLSAESIALFFKRGGFAVEAVAYVRAQILDPVNDVRPHIEGPDCDFGREPERDPYSDVERFVVKVVPIRRGLVHALDGWRKIGALPPPLSDPKLALRDAESTITDLRTQLQAERAARDDLATALGEAARCAAVIEARVNQMADRRKHVETSLLEREDTIAQLQSELAAAQSNRDSLEKDLLLMAEQRRTLEQSLQQFQLQMSGQIQSERASARAQIDLLESSVMATRASLDAATSRLADGQRKISDLQAHISKGAVYVDELLAQLAAKSRQIEVGAAYARRLESTIAELEGRLAERCQAFDALHRALVFACSAITETTDDLLAGMGQPPITRAEGGERSSDELIASIQIEAERLVRVGAAVRASRFSRLRRFLRRMVR